MCVVWCGVAQYEPTENTASDKGVERKKKVAKSNNGILLNGKHIIPFDFLFLFLLIHSISLLFPPRLILRFSVFFFFIFMHSKRHIDEVPKTIERTIYSKFCTLSTDGMRCAQAHATHTMQ